MRAETEPAHIYGAEPSARSLRRGAGGVVMRLVTVLAATAAAWAKVSAEVEVGARFAG